MNMGYQSVTEMRADLARLVAMVRAADDLSAPVPGLQWTAAQAATHLALALRGLAATMRGEISDFTDIAVPGLSARETAATANAKMLEAVCITDPAEAAEALERAGDALATAAQTADPETDCATPWYGPGSSRKAGCVAAVGHGEILMHGLDIARALRKPWKLPGKSAASVAYAVMTGMLPHMLTPAGRAFTGVYEIRLRGGADFMLAFGDGAVTVLDPAATHGTVPGNTRVDCTMSLTPAAALLAAYGRIPLWRLIITGRAFAGGRKPWLGMRFPSLVDNP